MEDVYVEEFTSPGCVGCPAVKAMLEELSREFDGRVIVEEINIAEDASRAASYGIMTVPAVAVNGNLLFTGVPSRQDLRNAILEEMKED
ncbi:MAG TPA: thioredoxin [Candidatus Aminicenantes bacterium]|nr:thioredoxin family protein [Candidatus Aminicenantes bacterium]HDT14075.1 thioredoxin [Candidatus Aminicenantes bacterium]